MNTASAADGWLSSVAQRLSSGRFTLSENVSFQGYTFRLVAHRSRFELTKFGNVDTFFVFADFDALDEQAIRRFSAAGFAYAKVQRSCPLPCGLFEGVYCYAVAMVNALDANTARSLRERTPPKHWAAAEIPVVYERGPRKLCFFQKTPMWGAAYYAGFRREIQRFLSPG